MRSHILPALTLLILGLGSGCSSSPLGFDGGGGKPGSGSAGSSAGHGGGFGGQDGGLDSANGATACSGNSDCGSGQYCLGFSQLCAGAPNDYTVGVGTCHRDCSTGACSCTDDLDCGVGKGCYNGNCAVDPILNCPEEPSSCPPGCTFEQASDRVCGPVCRCEVCPAADGGSNTDALSADAASDKQTLPQCRWPTSLNDAGPDGCRASRALVSCNGPSGGCDCTSDESTTCPASVTCGLAYGYTTCQDQCAESEYAVACGGLPQPDAAYVDQQPPSGCRLALATPAGVAFYCCPCE